jgi:hypothetical protein
LGKPLDIPVRFRYLVLQNLDTGGRVLVDLHYRRLNKLQKVISSWARVVEGHYPGRLMIALDLTYAEINDWENGHIGKYIKTLKGSLGDHLIAWAWVLEIQERGAPHYHVLVITDGVWPKFPDKSGHWKFGLSRTDRAKIPWYLMKYTGKEHQKDFTRFPRGARAYGVGFRDEAAREDYKVLRDQKYDRDENIKWTRVGSATRKNIAINLYMKNKVKSE